MWKRFIVLLALIAVLVGSAVPGYAWDGRRYGHRRSHVFIAPRVIVPVPLGGPYWGPYWDPYWVHYPRTRVVIEQPPVYVQPPPTYVQPPPQPQYWYYCEDPKGYYPYVQQCSVGWMQVVPPTAPPAQ